jgi:hypothetical protein
MAISGIDARLAKERRARLQAERLLALRSEELYSANRKLSEHAHALSSQVIEQREENAALKGQTTQVAAELEVATEPRRACRTAAVGFADRRGGRVRDLRPGLQAGRGQPGLSVPVRGDQRRGPGREL